MVNYRRRDLAPTADGTELTFTHAELGSEASEKGHAWGWTGAFDKLVRHLERADGPATLTTEKRI